MPHEAGDAGIKKSDPWSPRSGKRWSGWTLVFCPSRHERALNFCNDIPSEPASHWLHVLDRSRCVFWASRRT